MFKANAQWGLIIINVETKTTLLFFVFFSTYSFRDCLGRTYIFSTEDYCSLQQLCSCLYNCLRFHFTASVHNIIHCLYIRIIYRYYIHVMYCIVVLIFFFFIYSFTTHLFFRLFSVYGSVFVYLNFYFILRP